MHLPLPAYEASFRAFANRVSLGRPWTGDPTHDARALLDAIASGRVYTVIDALASPGALELTASNGDTDAAMGDRLAMGATTRVRARLAGPPGTVLTLIRNGEALEQTTGSSLDVDVSSRPGVYRVEAHVPREPGHPSMPWIVSNPIYIGVADGAGEPAPAPSAARIDEVDLTGADGEAGRACTSDVSPPDAEGAVRWQWALAPGAPTGQFAAVRIPIGNLASAQAVRIRVRSDRPARLWLQARAGAATERWGTTFYAEATEREVDVRLPRLRPIGRPSSASPPLANVDSLLIVVDTLNARPGQRGGVTIRSVALVR
jgi:hypothetical protein